MSIEGVGLLLLGVFGIQALVWWWHWLRRERRFKDYLARIDKDWTEQVQLQRELALVGEQSPTPMWIKNGDSRVIWVNQAYETVFLAPHGFAREDLIGHYDHAVWGDETADAFRRSDQRTLKEGTLFAIEDAEIQQRRFPLFVCSATIDLGGGQFRIKGWAQPLDTILACAIKHNGLPVLCRHLKLLAQDVNHGTKR